MVPVLAWLVFIAAVVVYAAPSTIAILRAQKRWPLVIAINVLLGWTILGWLAALAMSLGLQLPKRVKRAKARARRAPIPTRASKATVAPEADHAAPVREHAEPPKLHDDSYAHWLDEGAAMKA